MANIHELKSQIVKGVSGEVYISIRVPDDNLGMTDRLMTREEFDRMLNDMGGGAAEEGEQVVS